MTQKKPPRTQVKIDLELYNQLKLIAMAEKMTIVDLVENLIRKGYKNTYGYKTEEQILKEKL